MALSQENSFPKGNIEDCSVRRKYVRSLQLNMGFHFEAYLSTTSSISRRAYDLCFYYKQHHESRTHFENTMSAIVSTLNTQGERFN
jgi:hypothetical protein